jgi:FRG domain
VDTPVIKTPPPSATVGNLADFLKVSGEWHDKHSRPGSGMLSNLWYRGVNEDFPVQSPRVYRRYFTERADELFDMIGDPEKRRLHFEGKMISEFRTAGAAFLTNYTRTEIYFAAQHYGMPTRLLDWSTNPLAALFFACEGKERQDGCVYAMDATKVIRDSVSRSG